MSPQGKFHIAICAAGVLLNVALAWNVFLPNAWQGRNDFLGFYAGARLAGSENLYQRESVRQEHLSASGETGEIQYGRLPAYALALKPLAGLPYGRAYAVWETLQVAALLGFILLWPGVDLAAKCLLCTWSLPAFVSLFNGQDDLLLLLWVALSARLLGRGRPLAAGVVLALFAASKFHLFTLVPIVLLAQRRWRVLAGAALSGCGLLAISFAAAGRNWPLGLYKLVTDSRVSTGLGHMPNLHSLLGALPFSFPLQMAASLLLAAGVYRASRNTGSFEVAIGLALGGGVLVGYHAYLHDGVLFLPLLMALHAAAAPYARIPAVMLITPLPWCVLQLTRPFPIAAQVLIVICLLGAIGMLWQTRSASRLPEPVASQ